MTQTFVTMTQLWAFIKILALANVAYATQKPSDKDAVIQQLLDKQEENTKLFENLYKRLAEDEKIIDELKREKEMRNRDIQFPPLLQENDYAFYVHLSTGDYSVTDGSIIIYDVIDTNLGNGYNPASGSFTCLQNGYYVFTTFYVTLPGTTSDLAIMANDNIICRGFAYDEYNQGTCTAIVELQVGDVVNVKAVNGPVDLYGGFTNLNGFVGFIYKAL